MRLETLKSPAVRRYVLAFLGLSPLLVFSASRAADVPAPPVSLVWNANPESNIAGYKVHFGTASGTYSQVIDVQNQTSAALPQLILGNTYYLAVSAYNADGQESPKSTEMVLSATPPAPAESTSLTVSGPGNGKLAWKHPKSATTSAVGGPAEGFAVYGSEDLVNWTLVQNVDATQATRSDSQYFYFEWPFSATKGKMFYKVGAGNAFGETK
ncbi:fibronectin type III domain-containing protein [Luteolibacter luteus]|uniref:Fibronectin type III domain-containing protein n=1 Tax=Luteolibacter luteus TaxID=2728835 RepID=A0A858RPN2_9BACT|nr:fibronectin type III domain-containing protein [Luteolibacter luteus]QJE98581.1 fibronectin type III domain-containing protein [Luteolibacter luteus]